MPGGRVAACRATGSGAGAAWPRASTSPPSAAILSPFAPLRIQRAQHAETRCALHDQGGSLSSDGYGPTEAWARAGRPLRAPRGAVASCSHATASDGQGRTTSSAYAASSTVRVSSTTSLRPSNVRQSGSRIELAATLVHRRRACSGEFGACEAQAQTAERDVDPGTAAGNERTFGVPFPPW